MNSIKIRQKFLDFFKKNGHTIVPSSSLIPAEDPTLLFTNAGMNQFKDIFLGKEKRKYTKATSIQKCVRAGGKHNDLDEVGFTNRHLTFFEMMGNFSFGDYFKKEAIEFAWEFLTKDVKITKEKMLITIYKDDEEAYKIWNNIIKIPKEKIFRLDEKDNFWQMGDTGPCGPCSEIHYDSGPEIGCKKLTCSPACSCGRFVEIWNLVFMQFDRQQKGSLIPLKQKGIDTGMGFERLCMILQNKDSIFQTDIFQPLIKKIEDLTKISYQKSNENKKIAFHILIDHVRSSSLLIADGCMPSNEGRGYVLRKIIRRAALFSQKLSTNPKLFSTIANEFICQMSLIYPELKINHDLIINLLDIEIEKFTSNLISGKNILEKYIQENKKEKIVTLSGTQIFKLYDTYGFPPELTLIIAKENNLTLDMKSFEKEMEKQQKQSSVKATEKESAIKIPEDISTKFVGYEKLEIETKINFIEKENSNILISTEESPFYVESGGQESDNGWVIINEKTFPIISINKYGKTKNPAIILKISTDKIKDKIKIGDKIKCVVDNYKRINTEKNHTATHLLQAALVQVLGKQIKQAGSLVNDKHLRFDFTNLKALTKEQIKQVENIVNEKIEENIKLNIFFTTLEKAKVEGVTAFFGEKYNPENVRVIQIPGFSAELCGGTHIESTGKIGCFKIENDIALSAGVRRITAVTGPEAIKLFQQSFNIIKTLGEQFKVKIEQIIPAIEKQQENFIKLQSEIKQLKKQIWKNQIPIWQNEVKQIGKIPFLFLKIEDIDGIDLKQISKEIENKQPGFYFIISQNEKNPNQINYFCYLSKKWEPAIDFKNFTKFLKEKFDFKGGGSTTLIQGGGKKIDFNKLKDEIINWIKLI